MGGLQLPDVLSGESALNATVDLLLTEVGHRDPEIAQHVRSKKERKHLCSLVRSILVEAFDGASWPHMQVGPKLINGLSLELLPLLQGAFALPRAPGQELVLSAVDVLQSDRIFAQCRDAVLPTVGNKEGVGVAVDAESASPEKSSFIGSAALAGSSPAGTGGQTAEEDEDINIHSLEELNLDISTARSAAQAWAAFLAAEESPEMVAQTIFSSIFEAAPKMRTLFTTSGSMHHVRFMSSLATCLKNLEDPPALKMIVESLGFSHMSFDVQMKHVVTFRVAIIDTISMELGESFSRAASTGINCQSSTREFADADA